MRGVMKLKITFLTHLMVADALTKSFPGPALQLRRHVRLGHMRLFHGGNLPVYARFLHSA